MKSCDRKRNGYLIPNLTYKSGEQLFKEKEYLGKLDNQKEVEKLLEQYILRFERNTKGECSVFGGVKKRQEQQVAEKNESREADLGVRTV